MYLMLGEKRVYSVADEIVCWPEGLPGLMSAAPNNYILKEWLKHRYSAGSNSLARVLGLTTFGHRSRSDIDAITGAFSLSDAYWLSVDGNGADFVRLTPYNNAFFTGGVYSNGISIPTLYVSGFKSKFWRSPYELVKLGDHTDIVAEYSAIQLCKSLNLGVNDAYIERDVSGKSQLVIINMTHPAVMLETVEMSGRLPEDFTDEQVVTEFGLPGVAMLTIDAIVGNGDRHWGNFGWFRDVVTGAYVKMADLYDFDHALDAAGTDDVLIDSLSVLSDKSRLYAVQIVQQALICLHDGSVTDEYFAQVFAERCKAVLARIGVK